MNLASEILVVLVATSILAPAQTSQPETAASQQTYLKATVSASQQLTIVTSDGKEISPKRQPEQISFDKVTISSDKHAVGWLAAFPNATTAYPLPLQVVVYSNGTERHFAGNQLPVWRWSFQDGGRQVAFEQETVHGGLGVHYELRDVASGELVAQYDPQPGAKPSDAPKWVEELNTNAR